MFDEVRKILIDQLISRQKESGEFCTFSSPKCGPSFYIGPSPFVSSLISFTLNDVSDSRIEGVQDKIMNFLEGLDESNLRLYRFWYAKTVRNTLYPLLPFDLDDTAVVNTVLALRNKKTVNMAVVDSNKLSDYTYYTWLQPRLRTLLRFPELLPAYWDYVKLVPLFRRMSNGSSMASFKDSEALVNMNVILLRMVLDSTSQFSLNDYPVDVGGIKSFLSNCMHYDNESMYCLTLAKMIKCGGGMDEDILLNFESTVRILIKSRFECKNYADTWALLLSLIYINVVKESDVFLLEELCGCYQTWIDMPFNVCVGNKKYPGFHVYWSTDLTCSFALTVIDYMKLG